MSETPGPRAGATLLETVEIETPEHVAFSYEIAGLGSRFCALLADTLLIALGFIGILFLLPQLPEPVVSASEGLSPPWLVFLTVLIWFLLYWGYFLVFEGAWDGQTPGKKLMGLRAVGEGGYPMTLGAAAVRNLLRLVDMQPAGSYFVGAVTMLLNRQANRLGDLAAGTIVVRERTLLEAAGSASALREPLEAPEGVGPPRLADRELALLQRFVVRRSRLAEAARDRLEGELVRALEGRYPRSGSQDASDYLRGVLQAEQARRRRRRDAPLHAGERLPFAARFVRGKEPRWWRLAAYVARTRRQGLTELTPTELSEFAGLYREAAADLARARTYGAEVPVLFRLEQLVAAGHSVFYRRRRVGVRSVWHFLRRDFPQRVRRHALPIGVAATILLLPAVLGFVRVVFEPEAAYRLLDPQIIARAEAAPDRIAAGKGYLEVPSLFMPVLAGGIIANNVQVTFAAFAFGITAGLGTVLLLLFNGLHIGATLGLFQSVGAGGYVWAFVLPHGIVELTAAAIAGGAGLLLGSALVLPGELTRREALVERGRSAVALLGGTSVLLVLAGLVEGFVSPSLLPDQAKVVFGLLLGGVLFLYLFVQGQDAEPPDAG